MHHIEQTPALKVMLQSKIDESKTQAKELSQLNLASIDNSKKLLLGLSPKYWRYMREYSPIEELKKTKKPVLILQGEKDYQVTLKKDFELWKQNFWNEARVTMNSYPNLNHLFMASPPDSKSELSTPTDYTIPASVDPQPIVDICSWMQSQNK
jgi:hypothetical protein